MMNSEKNKTMDRQLHRIMTLKSKIGFGYFKDLTVGELIGTNKHYDLLRMYYGLEKIDFNTEVKEILHLTTNRQIVKPGRDYEFSKENLALIMREIRDSKTDQERKLEQRDISWQRKNAFVRKQIKERKQRQGYATKHNNTPK